MRSFISVVMLGTAIVSCGCGEKKSAKISQEAARRTSRDQQAAADRLADLGPKAAPKVPQLIASLASSDADVRWKAARALGNIGEPAHDAVPALIKVLADADPRARVHAAHSLGTIGDKSEPVVASLANLVVDPDARVRRASLAALRELQPGSAVAIPLMIKALDDANPAVVMPALQTLAEGGAAAVPALVEALGHKQGRYWACLVLSEIGPAAKDAAPALEKLAKDDEPEVRMQALLALGEIGPEAQNTVPTVIAELEDPLGGVRYAAAMALGKLGSADAVPALNKAMEQGDDKFLGTVAAWSLAKLQPDNKESVEKAINMLVAALKQEDPKVRHAAAQALLDLHASPEVVGPALLAALDDPDPEVQANVYSGLASLGEDAVPRLVERLKDPQTQDKALRILGLMGPQGKTAVPHLIEILGNANAEARREIIYTLASIGSEGGEATSHLIKLLEDKDDDVRVAAAYALGKIGPPAAAAADALMSNAQNKDSVLSLVSVWALLRVRPDDPAVVKVALPVLIKAVTSGETELTRIEAAAALSELGAAARPARAALQKATHDENHAVREAAAAALQKIGT